MTTPGCCTLVEVLQVGASSVVFLPHEDTKLDLKTINSSPPTHRTALQQEGMAVKCFVGVSLVASPKRRGRSASSWGGASRVTAAAPSLIAVGAESDLWKREALEKENCGNVWQLVLRSAKLIGGKGTDDSFVGEAAMSWPCLTEVGYKRRVMALKERQQSSEVNHSSFCVPVLRVEEYVFKQTGCQVSLCAIWMPYYPQTIQQWARDYTMEGRIVPENHLIAALHHMTLGLLTLRKAVSAASPSSSDAKGGTGRASLCIFSPTTENIVVFSNKEGGEPIFMVSMGVSSTRTASERYTECVMDSRFIAPEHCSATEREQESRVNGRLLPHDDPKQDVWAMGMMLYIMASGAAEDTVPSPSSVKSGRRSADTPMNDPSMTPDLMWRRIRRSLENRGYSSIIAHVIAQLLSLDPLSRPSLATLDSLLVDLHRPTPIVRFPFALGSFDLLRLPDVELVEVNPGAWRYNSSDVCCVCRKERTDRKCRTDEHAEGLASPSWNDDELLPELPANLSTYMTFGYPLQGSVEPSLQRRRLVAKGLQGSGGMASAAASINGSISLFMGNGTLDCSYLFQMFGGFILYERVPNRNSKGKVYDKIEVRDVFVPFPVGGLRRGEQSLVSRRIHFGGALPWPSSCTAVLQQSGRITRQLPFSFTGSYHDVRWCAWILPGERFALRNGRTWTAPHDGAFAFWFDDNLSPTDRDRYFPLTSVRAMNLQTKVPRTTLPDQVFRQHIEAEEGHTNSAMLSRVGSRNLLNRSTTTASSSALRRRSSQSFINVKLPRGSEIAEERDSTILVQCNSLPESPSRSRSLPSPIGSPAESPQQVSNRLPRRRRPSSHRLSIVAVKPMTPSKSSPGTRSLDRRPNGSHTSKQPEAQIQNPPFASAEVANGFHKDAPLRRSSTNTGAAYPDEKASTLPELKSWGGRQTAAEPQRNGKDAAENAVGSILNPAPAHGLTKHETPPIQQNRPFKRNGVNGNGNGTAAHLGKETGPGDNARYDIVTPQGSLGRIGRATSRSLLGSTRTSPQLPPLILNESAALSTLNLYGTWLHPGNIDATFEALTFCISSTGEHGFLQPPIPVTNAVHHILKAPLGASYIAFMSNQIPLFQRNHPQMNSTALSRLLPHHGFACYTSDGTLLAVLSLRIAGKALPKVTLDEFKLNTRVLPAIKNTTDSARLYYASYLPQSLGDVKYILSQQHRASELPANPLNHNPFGLPGAPNMNGGVVKTPEGQTLTFSSARHLVGEFTPVESSAGDFYDAADVLPACWVGFSAEEMALVFTDIEQTCWVPYSIKD